MENFQRTLKGEKMTLTELKTKYALFLSDVNPTDNHLIGREEELNLLTESLLKKRYRNTILVGEAGCGKTALLEEFAYRMKAKATVLELSMAASLTDTQYRGQYEGKIVECMNDICSYNLVHPNRPIILFIDEIHTIMKAGDTEGAISFANIIKPFLSKMQITIIGATTRAEYQNTIKKDVAIKRRLSPIFVNNLEEDVVINILNEFSEGKVEKGVLKYIYNQSYSIPDSNNPDISIEILDRCMARIQRLEKERITIDIVDYICQNLRG